MIVAFKVIRATGLFFVFVAKTQTQKSYYALIISIEMCITESNMVRLPIFARQRSVALRFVEKSWTCRGTEGSLQSSLIDVMKEDLKLVDKKPNERVEAQYSNKFV